ncbi:HAD hydrolase family protein [Candidatus Pacearchaeota archaeon]|nr:HAD hydrolase family protein [Candidatus Pacearchaeota archaeon]
MEKTRGSPRMMNFIIDVDGVMTTGQFLYDSKGKSHKIFGPHDSDGLKLIKDKMNIQFISADKRGFPISKRRIEDMGYPIELVPEASRFDFIKNKWGFQNTIYMGDGIFDAPILKACTFGIAPQNARQEAKKSANFVTYSKSAEGAVCDACMEIKKRFLGDHEKL